MKTINVVILILLSASFAVVADMLQYVLPDTFIYGLVTGAGAVLLTFILFNIMKCK